MLQRPEAVRRSQKTPISLQVIINIEMTGVIDIEGVFFMSKRELNRRYIDL